MRIFSAILFLVSSTAMSAGVIPSNTLRLGDGTASSKSILFHRGLGVFTPAFRWNETQSRLEFSNDGVNFLAVLQSAGIGASYDRVVGSAAQVAAGTATDTTISSAITACPNPCAVKIAEGTFTETVTVTKGVFLDGSGYGTQINGTVTFASGSSKSLMRALRVLGNVTINSGGIDGVIIDNVWISTGNTVIDNSDVTTHQLITAFYE